MTTAIARSRGALLGLLVLLAAGACGPSTRSEYPLIEPPSLSIGDGSVWVSGDTDLPDSAHLDLTALDDKGHTATGAAVVGGGHYKGQIGVHGWPSGTLTVWVEFWPSDGAQPHVVAEMYGIDGRHMVGGRVRTDPDGPGLEWFGAYDVDLP